MTSSSVAATGHAGDQLETAMKLVNKHLQADNSYLDLAQLLKVNSHNTPSSSGLSEADYPVLSDPRIGLRDLPELSTPNHTALPPELVEQFNYMQCSTIMGLFPEISRAWVAIDSDIFVWNFEDGSDLAYFDGLTETILCAALVTPRAGVFQPHIRYLLALCTPVDVVLLGVSFSADPGGQDELSEMHLLPEPLFSLPSDNTHFLSVAGTQDGRVFLAGKDCCLYELSYQAEDGWFSRRCKLINHSVSKLSFLVPSFLNFSFSHDDSLAQIVVDETRHILYTRSEKGSIQVFDLGNDGRQARRVVALHPGTICQQAASIARTVEKSHFEKLVHIAPITARESSFLHLVAITESGSRLYFCTVPFGRGTDRPHMLQLVSVRLPPGFSAALHQPKPSKVQTAFYNEGLLLLASSQSDETDLLWSISADSFPFHKQLMEALATLPIVGKVWCLAQLPGQQSTADDSTSKGRSNPPLVVSQHQPSARQIVLLTDKGTYTLHKLRPVDQLRHLLKLCGPDSDEVRAFFSLHREDQACATAIIAASSRLPSEVEVVERSTSAVFLYGGEPSFMLGTNSQFPISSPEVQSTTQPGAVGNWLGAAAGGSELQYSHRFNGICLVLARIMRPLWECPMAAELPYMTSPGRTTKVLCSAWSTAALAQCRAQVLALREFVLTNIQTKPQPLPDAGFSEGATARGALVRPDLAGERSSEQHRRRKKVEASNAERQALVQLMRLMERCAEVLGLWEILSEHQFHVVAAGLSRERLISLRSCTLQGLLSNDTELVQGLIQSLIQQYIGDNASTDAISSRLRDLAPNLYSSEDAYCSKANELMATARVTSNRGEQEQLLKEALKLYKEVCPNLDLPVICAQFSSCHCYSAVLDLCLCAATRRDPTGLGLAYYLRGQPPSDAQGQDAFYFRMDCYRCVIETLEQLQEASSGHGAGVKATELTAQLKQPSAVLKLQQMYDDILRSEDQLLHIALFEWLLTSGQTDKLLQLDSPHVESYLRGQCQVDTENLSVWELLWRLLEKQRNFSEAARILASLAERHSRNITLSERVEYLSRAVVCARSASLNATPAHANFLLDLQDKMEVCRVQQQLYSAIKSSTVINKEQKTECLAQLDSQLVDITTLFSEFAEPFSLTEIKLAIVHCANHHDPGLIESLWREIIEKELNLVSSLSVEAQMDALQKKVVGLGNYYASSERYFPLSHVLGCLEEVACRQRFSAGWVVSHVLLPLEVPLIRVLQLYDARIKTRDRLWTELGQPWHLTRQLTYLLETFTRQPHLVSELERRSFVSACLDATSGCLVELSSAADKSAYTLASELRSVQSQLKAMDNGF